jgi:hypothetical protein
MRRSAHSSTYLRTGREAIIDPGLRGIAVNPLVPAAAVGQLGQTVWSGATANLANRRSVPDQLPRHEEGDCAEIEADERERRPVAGA